MSSFYGNCSGVTEGGSGEGGGGSVGTATLIFDEARGITTDVELNNLTSFSDYTAMGSPATFSESASIILDSENVKCTQSGLHGFSFYEPSSGVIIIVEHVGYHTMYVEPDVEPDLSNPNGFSPRVCDCIVYRVYEDSAWGAWIDAAVFV